MNSQIQNQVDALQAVRTFVMIILDGYQWLLPQTEVQALETLLDIDREVRVPQSIGAIAFAGEWRPVYCLSGELHLLPHIPAERRICLLLDNGADCFGLACDQIETVLEPFHLHSVPVCMTSPDSPIQALALLNQTLGCVTTTEHIARLIATAEDHARV